MSADFSALGLIDEELPEVAVGELPETGGFELVQPGFYRFKLPASEAIVAASSAFQTPDKGQRIKVSFKKIKDGPNASLWMPALAKGFSTSLTNIERKQGDYVVSDLASLLQALGVEGSFSRNQEYLDALVRSAGVEFDAEVEWSASCNPKSSIYGEDGQKDDSKKGCGQSYKQRAFEYKKGPKAGTKVFAIPTDHQGKYAERFQCATEGCGAILRCFGNLRNFRQAK